MSACSPWIDLLCATVLVCLHRSEFNYTQWENKEVFEERFLEKLDDEQVRHGRWFSTDESLLFVIHSVQNLGSVSHSSRQTPTGLHDERLHQFFPNETG